MNKEHVDMTCHILMFFRFFLENIKHVDKTYVETLSAWMNRPHGFYFSCYVKCIYFSVTPHKLVLCPIQVSHVNHYLTFLYAVQKDTLWIL